MSIRIIRYKDFVAKVYPKPEPLIDGIICRSELIILSAKAKSYKSMLTSYMAICCARGAPFLEHFHTTKSNVLIVQTEVSQANLKERLEEMADGEIIENLFIADPANIKIDNLEDMNELEKVLKENAIDLLILDPLYTLHKGDENSASDMSKILFGLKELVVRLNIGCILVHHQGKKYEHSESRQAGQKHRGSSAMADVPDGSISLDKKNDGTISITAEFRNRAEPEQLLIQFNNNSFELLQTIQKPDDPTSAVILRFLSNQKELATRGVIVDAVKEDPLSNRVTTRTIDNRLKHLVETNQIIKSAHGSYRLQNSNAL
jgi:hypothetical protein